MASLVGIFVLAVVILIFALIAVFLIKNIVYLIINAIIGLVTLFLVNYFNVMQYFGKPDIPYDFVTIIICALGGFFGAILVIVLSLLGVPV
jgi:hypothetical protein